MTLLRMQLSKRLIGCAIALAALAMTDAAVAADEVLELQAGRHFQGEIRSAAIDQDGIAWIATKYQLFRSEQGRVRLIDSAGDNRRLALAPGAQRYAWLSSDKSEFGQFGVSLQGTDRPATPTSLLEARELPPGFASIYLGRKGRLIVAIRPLQDLEGLRGEFGYALFTNDGASHVVLVRNELRDVVIDDGSTATLLLGNSSAESINSSGKELWTVTGRFDVAALADGGNVAVLAQSNGDREVRIVRHGTVTRTPMRLPVRKVAITPDGNLAAVVTESGRISVIDLQRCTPVRCEVRTLPPLRILGHHLITDIRFLDRANIALGLILGTGLVGSTYYYAGSVAVVSTRGDPIFDRVIDVSYPATDGPQLDVTFGLRQFAAFTPSAAVFVSIRR